MVQVVKPKVNPMTGGNSKPHLRMLTSAYFTNSFKNYNFEHVYDGEAEQGQVFEDCGHELCEAFLKGKNCNLIVYGPTSTGKTYTM